MIKSIRLACPLTVGPSRQNAFVDGARQRQSAPTVILLGVIFSSSLAATGWYRSISEERFVRLRKQASSFPEIRQSLRLPLAATMGRTSPR